MNFFANYLAALLDVRFIISGEIIQYQMPSTLRWILRSADDFGGDGLGTTSEHSCKILIRSNGFSSLINSSKLFTGSNWRNWKHHQNNLREPSFSWSLQREVFITVSGEWNIEETSSEVECNLWEISLLKVIHYMRANNSSLPRDN